VFICLFVLLSETLFVTLGRNLLLPASHASRFHLLSVAVGQIIVKGGSWGNAMFVWVAFGFTEIFDFGQSAQVVFHGFV